MSEQRYNDAPDWLCNTLTKVNGLARYQHEPGRRDHWQTPAELYASGRGDCEDFAIAYWYELRDTLPAPHIACLLSDHGEPHMVCVSGRWVLDVLADEPYQLKQRRDVLCVAYTLGEAHGCPVTWVEWVRRATPLAKWADVWRRMRTCTVQRSR